MNSKLNRESKQPIQVTKHHHYCKAAFTAMASPCEILVDTNDRDEAFALGLTAYNEVCRIEQKFSRYRSDNVLYELNNADGKSVVVDDETADLLDFANHLYDLSEGRFDITSGILRKAWTFDGSDRLPDPDTVSVLLNNIGWQKITWQRPHCTVPAGMEIDLGGIGKEYAVDKVFSLLQQQSGLAYLVNFGGDLRANGTRQDGSAWQVGIASIANQQDRNALTLSHAALATSGDQYRYLEKEGIRYSHILDTKTGWPVKQAPRAVTVVAPTCVEAGIYSSLAMMMGADAEDFLTSLNIQYWCVR